MPEGIDGELMGEEMAPDAMVEMAIATDEDMPVMIELEDGSVEISFGEEPDDADMAPFDANLAEYLDDPANLAGGAGPEWVISEEAGFPRADSGETIAWDGSLDAGEYVLTCVNNQLFVATPWAEGVQTVGSGLTVAAN